MQKAKFEYPLLCKAFNNGLNEKGKREGLLKRLKSIESRNKEQLDEIKYRQERQ